MNQQNRMFIANVKGLVMGLLAMAVGTSLTIKTASAEEAAMDPRVEAGILERIKPIGRANTGEAAAAAPAAAAPAAGSVDVKGAFQNACFACHGTGAAGAPILGKKDVWAPRIAQGSATLYDHALKGFKAMPPRGGSTLDDATIKAVVDYMVAESK